MDSTLLSALKHSGWVGNLIMVSLFGLSIFVWATFFNKWRTIRRIEGNTTSFIQEFRALKKDLFELAGRMGGGQDSPVSLIFQAALKDLQYHFVREGRNKINPRALDDVTNGVQRRLAAMQLEQRQGMVLLATATTVSPLMGLFGTVWGIMESFRDMWIHGAANITVVAPGISDALLVTVVGLLVAIPSSVGYNLLYNRQNQYQARAENFCSELVSCIERLYVES